MGLASVFDDHQPVFLGKLPDGIHVRRVAVEVHREYGLGARSDGFGNPSNIDCIGVGIHIHQHRRRPGMGNCQCGSNKSVSRCDDLIARSDFIRAQSELQRRRARIHANGILGFTKRCELFLEEIYFPSEDEVCALNYLGDGFINLRCDRGILRRKINERHLRLL